VVSSWQAVQLPGLNATGEEFTMRKLFTLLFVAAVALSLSLPAMAREGVNQYHGHKHHRHHKHHNKKS